MDDDDQRDPVTGLLHRKAFLKEVRDAQQSMPAGLRRGCLLILYFPVLRSVFEELTAGESAEDALCHLLAIVETRVRSRDTIGRISQQSLCILLKGCKEANAVVVADQYAALLHNIVVEVNGEPLPMTLRYRIVSLDADESRARHGVSRLIVAPPLDDHATLSKQIEIAGNKVDLSTSKVVSLSDVRNDRMDSAGKDDAGTVVKGSIVEIGARDSAHSWRLRPGMLIQRKPLICCFRLQPVGIASIESSMQTTDLFASVLSALALSSDAARPIVESQFILPIDAGQLAEDFPEWVSARCKNMRVAPSDICLSLSVESLSRELRTIAPILRQLNRAGIRLMLEGVGTSSQFRMMSSIANFDYLHISGRALNDSLLQVADRVQLQALVDDARQKHCEICSGGIDSEEMMAHAIAMNIEIGFGRLCGSSEAFPADAWVSWQSLQDP